RDRGRDQRLGLGVRKPRDRGGVRRRLGGSAPPSHRSAGADAGLAGVSCWEVVGSRKRLLHCSSSGPWTTPRSARKAQNVGAGLGGDLLSGAATPCRTSLSSGRWPRARYGPCP